jgi:hypothetical protein
MSAASILSWKVLRSILFPAVLLFISVCASVWLDLNVPRARGSSTYLAIHRFPSKTDPARPYVSWGILADYRQYTVCSVPVREVIALKIIPAALPPTKDMLSSSEIDELRAEAEGEVEGLSRDGGMIAHDNLGFTTAAGHSELLREAIHSQGLVASRVIRLGVFFVVTKVFLACLAIAMFCFTARRIFCLVRAGRRKQLGLCVVCGYQRQGLEVDTCPECGAAVRG